MLEVTKAQFFEIIGPMNVHPRTERECSHWERCGTREIVGRSEPGYACRDKEGRYTTERRYWLADRYAERATQAAKQVPTNDPTV